MILNGSVEILYPDSQSETLCMGSSFGVTPSMEKELMVGVMKTKVDDCQVSEQTPCVSSCFYSMSSEKKHCACIIIIVYLIIYLFV